jgi:hypothetical protein
MLASDYSTGSIHTNRLVTVIIILTTNDPYDLINNLSILTTLS